VRSLDTLGILISTTLILMIYTILYRENPAFRLAEHILVGATVGHAIVTGVFQVRDLAIIKFQNGLVTGNVRDIAYIVPMTLGILIYFQFSRRYRAISHTSIALMLGVGLALSARGLLSVNVIGQIIGAIVPLVSVENVVYALGLICVLSYFIYEKRASKLAGPLPKAGRYFLMLTMGAYFANAIMGRLSIVIGTLNDLLVDPAYYLIPIAFLLILADAFIRRKQVQMVTAK